MKHFYIIAFVLFSHFAYSQQLLELQVSDLKNLTKAEKIQIAEHLKNDKNIVYLSSVVADTSLFELINGYRVSKNLKPLLHNHRLDSLANYIARYNAENEEQLIHYSKIPSFKNSVDLLQVENLSYSFSLVSDINSVGVFFNTKDYLTGWINSPSHNKNMLCDLPTGSAKVLLRVIRINTQYKVEEYAVLEVDQSYSRRDLDNAYKETNRKLVTRKPKSGKNQ